MLKSEPVDFEINVIAENGEEYRGFFSALPQLSHRLTLQKDRKYRELLGDKPDQADEYSKLLSIYLADLGVRLVRTPNWWKETDGGLELESFNVISEIAQKVSEIIKKANDEIQAKAEKSRKELKDTKPL